MPITYNHNRHASLQSTYPLHLRKTSVLSTPIHWLQRSFRLTQTTCAFSSDINRRHASDHQSTNHCQHANSTLEIKHMLTSLACICVTLRTATHTSFSPMDSPPSPLCSICHLSSRFKGQPFQCTTLRHIQSYLSHTLFSMNHMILLPKYYLL